jgi:hypothetical protein
VYQKFVYKHYIFEKCKNEKNIYLLTYYPMLYRSSMELSQASSITIKPVEPARVATVPAPAAPTGVGTAATATPVMPFKQQLWQQPGHVAAAFPAVETSTTSPAAELSPLNVPTVDAALPASALYPAAVEDKVPVTTAAPPAVLEEKYSVPVTAAALPDILEEKYSVSTKEEEKVPVISEELAAALEAAATDFLFPEVIKVELDLEDYTSTYDR